MGSLRKTLDTFIGAEYFDNLKQLAVLSTSRPISNSSSLISQLHQNIAVGGVYFPVHHTKLSN